MFRSRASRGALLLVVIAAAAGLWLWRRARPAEVMVEEVVRGRVIEAVYATGTVEPIERVVVKARLSEHIGAVAVKEGDLVSAGQLLARIDTPVRRYALTQTQTQLAKARQQAGPRSPQLAALEAQERALNSQLELARLELARTEQLLARAAVTQQELDSARYRVTQLEAQAQAASAQLASTRLELGATAAQLSSQVRSLAAEADEGAVLSPIAGLVLRRAIEPGEVVAQNQELFEVADVSTLFIELKVDEADIARVRDGSTPSTVALSFFAFPGRAFAGTVAQILPQPDRQRRSYTVKVRLDAPIAGLRVGMTAEANIVVARKDDALLLPAEAIDGDSAWFVEGGRAVRRPVQLGLRDLTRVELLAGAAPGTLAILGAAGAALRSGDKVSAVRRAP